MQRPLQGRNLGGRIVFDGGMGRVLALVALAVVAVLGAIAAPALSTKPYQAEPVEFSAAGPSALGSPDPGEGIVSEPLRAPKRFNLVGMSWDLEATAAGDHDGHDHGADHGHADEPALAMRTRLDGGEWTDWAAVASHPEDGPDPGLDHAPGLDHGPAQGMSNPAWAGEADWVQYRSSRPLEGVRMHFVNTDGSATTSDRIETALRGAANSAVTAAAALVAPPAAGAEESQPAMVSRSSWAGSDCQPRGRAAYGEVRAAYIHHTVNLNDYSRAEAPQVVLGMCRYHRNVNGWNDIGYNFLVDRFGTLYEGRAGGIAAAVIGAQAEGFNSYSTGIANIGTFSTVPQSEAAIDAMARLIRWKLPLHGYPTTGQAAMVSAGGATNRFRSGATVRVNRILGHRDTNATECPGGALYAQLADLRERAAGVAPSGTATQIAATLDAPRSAIDFGQEAHVGGVLATRDGAPVAGQPVTVQALVDGTWKTSSTPVTGADGSYAAPIKPRLTRQLRVRFAGAGELRSAVSPTLTLAVRTAVRVSPSALRVKPGERVDLRGRVAPRVGRVLQVLRVQRDDRFRLAGRKWVKVGKRGYFRAWFTPAEKALYRVYYVANPTKTRARGASERFDIGAGVSPPSPANRGGAVAGGGGAQAKTR